MESKINGIEKSQKFMSDQYDTLSVCTNVNKKNIEHLQCEVKSLKKQNSDINNENSSLKESVIDLKCRSMRDNLLFFGIPEGSSQIKALSSTGVINESNIEDPRRDSNIEYPKTHQGPQKPAWMGRGNSSAYDAGTTDASMTSHLTSSAVSSTENCVYKIFDFCEKVLHISGASSRIEIDRAHRIGSFVKGKIRPVVVKFKNTDSKMLVKNALKNINLKQSDYNVSEQFPPEVKERRKQLIPELIKARNQGRKAVLVRDKLFIDNQLFNPDSYARNVSSD
jgi:hypothetical protein